MATSTTRTNKPINPRGNDQSPKGYNRAALYSGKALDFDGVNDQITFGTISDLTFGTGDFSVVLDWQIDSVSSYSWAIAKNPALDFGIGINNTGGLLRLWIGGTLSLGTKNILGSDWKKIAVVRESGVVSAYINGVAISLTETAMAGSIDSGDLIVGSWVSNADFWNGLLNNIRIFNTALTAAQVADLYNNPEKIVPTGVEDTALKLWLPMMEGAGTTAYDGSGNGNHGTISGATWTHGVGSPVAQTAVIDWNKGTNLLVYSEQFDNADWATTYATITANYTTAPDGSQTADKIEFTATGARIEDQFVNVANSLHIGSVFLKNDTIGSVQLEIIGGTPGILGQTTIDLTDGSLSASVGDYTPVATDAGNGWYRVSVGDTGDATIATPSLKIKRVSDNGSFYAWGAQVEASDSLGAYIPNHTGTPITSPVLLPQGLTSGRDITGVNLFENVRKQGALNLDGNSWAEVHDNASLDITDEVSLETWYYHDTTTTNEGLLGRWNATTTTYLLLKNDTNVRFYTKSTSAINVNASVSTAGWHHVVGTYDGTTMRIYLDGSESATIGQTGSINTSTFPLEIGRYYSSQTYAQTGAIAQPRIYNRALTAEEVQRNYDAGKNIYS